MLMAGVLVFLTSSLMAHVGWLGYGDRAGTKGMNVNDMPPEMREAYLANKATQKHAQRLAVSGTPQRRGEFMYYSRHFVYDDILLPPLTVVLFISLFDGNHACTCIALTLCGDHEPVTTRCLSGNQFDASSKTYDSVLNDLWGNF